MDDIMRQQTNNKRNFLLPRSTVSTEKFISSLTCVRIRVAGQFRCFRLLFTKMTFGKQRRTKLRQSGPLTVKFVKSKLYNGKIRIGEDYQAELPRKHTYEELSNPVNYECLTWKPSITISDYELQRFGQWVCYKQLCVEKSLKFLTDCGWNLRVAMNHLHSSITELTRKEIHLEFFDEEDKKVTYEYRDDLYKLRSA